MSNIFYFGLGTILPRIISFLMLPVVTRFIVPKDYGIVDLLTVTVSLTLHIVVLELGSAVV